MARKQHLGCFVGIDNYTAPLEATRDFDTLSIVYSAIFEPIFRAWECGSICRGLMVGGDVPGQHSGPYSDIGDFAKFTSDLSHGFEAFEVLGVGEKQIVALGDLVLGSGMDFLGQVRLKAEVPEKEIVPYATSWRLYSIRDVLQCARALCAGPNDRSVVAPVRVASVTQDDYPDPHPLCDVPLSFWTGLADAITEDLEAAKARVTAKMDAIEERVAARKRAQQDAEPAHSSKRRKSDSSSNDSRATDSDTEPAASTAHTSPETSFTTPAPSIPESPSAVVGLRVHRDDVASPLPCSPAVVHEDCCL